METIWFFNFFLKCKIYGKSIVPKMYERMARFKHIQVGECPEERGKKCFFPKMLIFRYGR